MTNPLPFAPFAPQPATAQTAGGGSVQAAGGGTAQAFETVTGTAGDDSWVFDSLGAAGRITIDAGAGYDRLTLDYRSFGAAPVMDASFDMMTGDFTEWVGCGGTEVVLASDTPHGLDEVTFYAGNLGSRLGSNSYGFTMVLWGGHGADLFWSGTQADTVRLAGGDDMAMTGAGNDTILCGSGNDTVYGGIGDDSMFGGTGNDELFAHDGADRVNGAAGDDTITGGAGNDLLNGGAGADLITATSGLNTLLGGAGNDTIAGGSDGDLVRAGAGGDEVDGGDGADTVDAGLGDDTVLGAAGDDALTGGAGADSLAGGDGADTLRGGLGIDTLAGGDGADVLYGGQGDDLLTGGLQADRFVHNGTVMSGTDLVTDFDWSEDVLVLDDLAGNAADFSVQTGDLAGVGTTGVMDTFVVNDLTGETVWVLADVSALPSLMLEIGGASFDLMI